ncbi:modification methylase FokI [Mammaliicoccus lentus]|uniref:DNA adenine methylase n=1 Tax=Mammaliicoccus lentus TaxID=42858 RepID=UPI00085C86A6|nr:DNA adenine methylase [Mammaliicoccus lentus]SCU44041.1 modification methylase FokI [Mammaliicoccus lentus]
MRYIGNKNRILNHIDKLIKDKQIEGGIFADLFTGTGSVADHFKDRFEIITNDLLYYASVFSEAKVNFADIPNFAEFQKKYSMSPFDYWNTYNFSEEPYGFISLNFSPIGNRKFFKEKNAIKIDTIRFQIEECRKKGILNQKEYIFLLASLLESVMGVSNTSGTYEAFFKNWESRSNKDFLFTPLSIEKRTVLSQKNKTYNQDANELAREIEGDIAYIDTPYTVTQYASAYHVLETIALNDNPEIAGKTGRRVERKMSNYSKRNAAKFAFEDLLRQLNFTHVIISYSNQSLIPLDEFIELVSKFAINEEVEVRTIDYREYKNLNSSKKNNGNQLQEVLIYFKKDFEIIKSPLNYAGSKDLVMKKIIKSLPPHITDFVDMMGGAFNVGANVAGTGKVFYNENNFFVYYIIEHLLNNENSVILKEIKCTINKHQLSKASKEPYIKFREYYNAINLYERKPIYLFILTLYSFQHMIRFNSQGGFNVPVGNSGLTDDIMRRIYNFRTKMPIGELFLGSFEKININEFDKDTLFYFDPPYIITAAAYNDGRRFRSEWNIDNELKLLNFLDKIDNNKQKFLLSNVIEHNGKRNDLLTEWVDKGGYSMEVIGSTGRRYPRTEVLIKNY